MQKLINILSEVKEINNIYELSNAKIEKTFQGMAGAKVCVPVIGKFSVGKSALVNTILGYANYKLKMDITPETTVPTEIVYDKEERAIVFYYDGRSEEYTIPQYQELVTDAGNVKCTRLYLDNQFMKMIPDVMLVDMPGFESDYEIHNKVIDDYLPQSMAYLIVIPADDMTLRESVGNILKELNLNNKPIYVVISKFDKRNEEEYEASRDKLEQSLKRYIGEKKVDFCISSERTADAEEVKAALEDIQEGSLQILENSFKDKVLSELNSTERYLKTVLENSSLSQSQLLEEEEKLKRRYEELKVGFSKEKGDFEIELKQCIFAMRNDVVSAVKSSESTLVTMIMNNSDISDYLNGIIREELTGSVKSRLIPLVEKYIRKLNKTIQTSELGDVAIHFSMQVDNISAGLTGAVVSGVAGAAALYLAGPIGPIVGIIATIVAGIFGLLASSAKREEQKNKVRSELNSKVYPQVAEEVSKRLELEVDKQIQMIQKSIDEDINSHKSSMQKAMEDLNKRITDEASTKMELEANIQQNLEKIEEMKNEL